MTGERARHRELHAEVPQLGRGVARARNEQAALVQKRHRHHVGRVVVEDGLGLPVAHVPQNAAAVTRAGDDLVVADEAAARKVALVLSQLAVNFVELDRLRAEVVIQLVHRAEVVQAARSHEAARRAVSPPPRRTGAAASTRASLAQGTHRPDGEYAHVMTHDERSGMLTRLFVVNASQT